MTPDEAKAYFVPLAVRKVGNEVTNAIFEIVFGYEVTGGSFVWRFNNVATAPIAFPPSAAQFEAALVATSTIGAGGASVVGAVGGPYWVEFIGPNAGQIVPAPVLDGTNLTPANVVQVTEKQQGSVTDYTATANTIWDNIEDAVNLKHRGLLVEQELLELAMGTASNMVDVRMGQINITDIKKSQRFDHLERLQAALTAKITNVIRSGQAEARRTAGGAMTTMTPGGLPFGVVVPNPYTGRME